jgi:hypothetical protein
MTLGRAGFNAAGPELKKFLVPLFSKSGHFPLFTRLGRAVLVSAPPAQS